MVPKGNTFLVVGGYDSNNYVDKIYEFDPVGMGWIQREQTLSTPRFEFFITAVEKSKFCH